MTDTMTTIELALPAGCTGFTYLVNPDCPDEGSDIAHDGPCAIHDERPAVDLTAFVASIVEGNAEAIRVDTTAGSPSSDTETLVLDIAGLQVCFTGQDILRDVDEVRSFLVGLQVDIVEARQVALDAERHECICGVLLDTDEPDCGGPRCVAYTQAERRYEASI